MPFTLSLETPEDTRRLASILARAVRACNPGAFLLYGGLGAGKTTLTRFLVGALPGGETAEASSPSFTICNIYCTKPEIRHFDLYRLEEGQPEEALEESFDTPDALTVVEWAERIADRDLPNDGVRCLLFFSPEQGMRRARLEAIGPLGEKFLEQVHYHTRKPDV